MKPEIKKLWVDALRSGEYKQGTGRLRTRRGIYRTPSKIGPISIPEIEI